jgi:hypothetical protein
MLISACRSLRLDCRTSHELEGQLGRSVLNGFVSKAGGLQTILCAHTPSTATVCEYLRWNWGYEGFEGLEAVNEGYVLAENMHRSFACFELGVIEA